MNRSRKFTMYTMVLDGRNNLTRIIVSTSEVAKLVVNRKPNKDSATFAEMQTAGKQQGNTCMVRLSHGCSRTGTVRINQ